MTLEELERQTIETRLAEVGNVTHVARSLGISTRTLQRKMRCYGWPRGIPGVGLPVKVTDVQSGEKNTPAFPECKGLVELGCESRLSGGVAVLLMPTPHPKKFYVRISELRPDARSSRVVHRHIHRKSVDLPTENS